MTADIDHILKMSMVHIKCLFTLVHVVQLTIIQFFLKAKIVDVQHFLKTNLL